MLATSVFFFRSSNSRQSQPAATTASAPASDEPDDSPRRASEPPPQRQAAAVRSTRRREADLLGSVTPVLSGPCAKKPNTAVTATIAPRPYSTSAPIASILPRMNRGSLLSTSMPVLMSALMPSWFCCDRWPTYAPPPISTAATTAVDDRARPRRARRHLHLDRRLDAARNVELRLVVLLPVLLDHDLVFAGRDLGAARRRAGELLVDDQAAARRRRAR